MCLNFIIFCFRYNTNEVEWLNQNFQYNNSSRNAKGPGRLEQFNTDPAAIQHENKESRNKYSNRMMANNYNGQRNTYDIGKKT